MKRFAVLIPVILLGCASGGSSGVVHLGSTVFPAKPEGCAVTVFSAETDVKRPFERICLLHSEGGPKIESAMKKMRKAACECGADAVIVTGMEQKGPTDIDYARSDVKATAIRFMDNRAE